MSGPLERRPLYYTTADEGQTVDRTATGYLPPIVESRRAARPVRSEYKPCGCLLLSGARMHAVTGARHYSGSLTRRDTSRVQAA